MKSFIKRLLISMSAILTVYACLPAQKVMALSVSTDFLPLQVLETAFVNITEGGETKTYGIAVNDPNVAIATRIRDTILVIGMAEGLTMITVYDFDTDERCYLSVNVTDSKILETPQLTATTTGNTLTLSWTRSRGADGYLLYFAPYGYLQPVQVRPGLYSGAYLHHLGRSAQRLSLLCPYSGL